MPGGSLKELKDAIQLERPRNFPNAPFAALILFQESISDDGPIYADKATTFAAVGVTTP